MQYLHHFDKNGRFKTEFSSSGTIVVLEGSEKNHRTIQAWDDKGSPSILGYVHLAPGESLVVKNEPHTISLNLP